MKKTLVLVVPALHLGGQERVCAKTAELLKDDFDVCVVIFDGTGIVYQPKCELIDINIPAHGSKIMKIFNAIRRAAALKKIRRERNADFVYSFGPTANLVNVLSMGQGKTIVGLRDYVMSSQMSRLNRFIYDRADLIIGCAEEACLPIRRNPLYREKTFCLYNPVDIGDIEKKASMPVDDYIFSPHTIISHGRLDKIKNWPRLIKAFSLVKKEIDDAQLIIIGEGEQRAELEQLIDTYNLSDSVTLPGFRSNPFAYISKSALYVLPSFSEGFPNSLVEGMVFVPVVSADCKSGPREILSTGPSTTVAENIEYADYGVLVKPAGEFKSSVDIDNEDRIMADAILAHFKDKEFCQKMKAAAYKRVQDFSCERYHHSLSCFLENLIDRGESKCP